MFNRIEHIGFQFTSEAVGKRWLKARLAYVIPTANNIQTKNVLNEEVILIDIQVIDYDYGFLCFNKGQNIL